MGNLWKKLAYMMMRRPDLALVLDRIRNKRERVQGTHADDDEPD